MRVCVRDCVRLCERDSVRECARRGNNSKSVDDFYLKAEIIIWPCRSDMSHVGLTADSPPSAERLGERCWDKPATLALHPTRSEHLGQTWNPHIKDKSEGVKDCGVALEFKLVLHYRANVENAVERTDSGFNIRGTPGRGSSFAARLRK